MTIVYILLFIIIAALAYFIYLQKQVKPQEIDINKALSTLINLNNEQLSKEKQIISTDLSNKKDAIEKMVKDIS
jgi:predicted Holliday junction resolvase-like endonuclease